MTRTVDYYFSLVSPWSYLGNAKLANIAKKTNTAISYKPVKVLEVFEKSGGLPLGKRAPQRQAYRLVELERWRKNLNVPLTIHPKFFPADETLAAGLVIATEQTGQSAAPLVQAIMEAVWVEDRNIADDQTLKSIADKLGLDSTSLMEQARSDAVGAVWQAYTDEALQKQVFGVPTYVLNETLYWGQDRLSFLKEDLKDQTKQ